MIVDYWLIDRLLEDCLNDGWLFYCFVLLSKTIEDIRFCWRKYCFHIRFSNFIQESSWAQRRLVTWWQHRNIGVRARVIGVTTRLGWKRHKLGGALTGTREHGTVIPLPGLSLVTSHPSFVLIGWKWTFGHPWWQHWMAQVPESTAQWVTAGKEILAHPHLTVHFLARRKPLKCLWSWSQDLILLASILWSWR